MTTPTGFNCPISHERDNMYFNYRTCGIAINNGRVLAVKIAPYDFWLFPGGRIEYLESSKAALEREIKEELNMPCQIGRLLWLAEDFYNFENQKTHELCYYYLIDFPDSKEIYEKEEWVVNEPQKLHESAKKLTFQWIPLETLDKVNLIPHYVKVKLDSIPEEINLLIINHLISKENS
jgi:8-oxo-dGTP pyrophosphatase MutT (NUDIX family)